MLITKFKKNLAIFSTSNFIMTLLTLFFVIYALFSSNVPRILEFEHYTMFLILFLIVCLYLFDLKNFKFDEYLKKNILALIFFFIFVYGVIRGIFLNNLDQNVIRDLTGVASILSIFLLVYLKEKNEKYIKILIKVLIYTGLIFSIKAIIFNKFFLDYGKYPDGNIIKVAKYYFLYLENTIVLALVFFFLKIYEHTEKKKFIKIIKYSILLFFPVFILSLYAMRGPIMFVCFFTIIFFSIKNKSFKGVLFSIGLLISIIFPILIIFIFPLMYLVLNTKKKFTYIMCSVFFFLFILEHVYLFSFGLSNISHKNFLDHQFIQKIFQFNIFNNRGKEFDLIIQNFNYVEMLMGKGFGSLFNNPINNSNVLFFHNFFLYYFYKLGVIGILFVVLIFILIIIRVYKIFLNFESFSNYDKVIIVSLIVSICYPLTLSATYKSVSFGFIMALFLIISINYDSGKRKI